MKRLAVPTPAADTELVTVGMLGRDTDGVELVGTGLSLVRFTPRRNAIHAVALVVRINCLLMSL